MTSSTRFDALVDAAMGVGTICTLVAAQIEGDERAVMEVLDDVLVRAASEAVESIGRGRNDG